MSGIENRLDTLLADVVDLGLPAERAACVIAAYVTGRALGG